MSVLLIFGLLFILNDYDLELFRYGCLLSFSMFLGYLIYDMARGMKKYVRLLEIEKELNLSWGNYESLSDPCEKVFLRMIQKLYTQKAELELNQQKEQNDVKEYYSTWVHQVKTPISAMRILLEEEVLSGRELKDQLFFIEQYVEMALGFVRLQSIAGDLLIAPYSLERMMKTCIRKFRFLFIRKNLKMELGDLSVSVFTDEKWFVFALEQFISNAVKYTSIGSVRIFCEGSEERKIVLCIQDTGIGIAQEDLPRVFEQGFTGYNGRMDQKASGIGLFLAKKVCDRLSHEIVIESEVGKGTKIKIKLTKL